MHERVHLSAEIQILQGAGERRRAQVADRAIPMVNFWTLVRGLVVVMVVVRNVPAVMQEGSRQCQEAHRKDEQTCEICTETTHLFATILQSYGMLGCDASVGDNPC
jgi:hypothetical protein